MSELTQEERIEKVYRGDVLGAWAFVLVLWATLGFVAWATWDLAPNENVRYLLLAMGGLVLLFNTAAIAAMVSHYREDKAFIYGLDLKNLDAMRRRGVM
jgi:uncharacterized membrane protein